MDYFLFCPSWSLGCEQLIYLCFVFSVVFWLKTEVDKPLLNGNIPVFADDETNMLFMKKYGTFPDFEVGMLLYRVYEWGPKVLYSVIVEVGRYVSCWKYVFGGFVPKVYRTPVYRLLLLMPDFVGSVDIL